MFSMEDDVPWKRVSNLGWNLGFLWEKNFGRDDLPDVVMLSTTLSAPSQGAPT